MTEINMYFERSGFMKNKNFEIETMLSHYGEERDKYHGAVVPPIFQNSLFTFEDYDAIDKAFENPTENYIYTRGLNPTVEITEKKIALLEEGEKAKLFASGMAAISSSILSFVNVGDHIITVKSIYGPSNNFISKYLQNKFNIQVTFVEGDCIQEIESSIQENTKLIYLESPSSFTFKLQDLRAVSKLAKANGIRTIIDNTWASPMYQKPLTLGIDVVVHSVSKYLSGHSDVVAGVVISSEETINQIAQLEYSLLGGKIAPFEAWLVLRGLRTLPIRMEKHSENAKEISIFLENHNIINKVNYPGLESFPQYKLAKEQMSGFSGLMSFEIDTDINGIKRFLHTLQYFKIGVSWGGYESLVYAPIISLAKELPEEKWKAAGIHPGMVRISVGLENVKDLVDDLRQALDSI